MFVQGEYLRLAQPLLLSLERISWLARIVVDEVHVFQEDDDDHSIYADLIHLVTSLPTVPMVAMTGTLTRDMEHQLISDLLIGTNCISNRHSANMPHHSYNVLPVDDVFLFSGISDSISATPSRRTSYYID